MPNFFDKYPYTDFHELNLDWIIKTVKEVVAEWAVTLTEWHNTQEEWQQLYNYVHDYFDNLDVQQEINNKLDEMALDGSLASVAQPIIDAKVASLLPGEVATQLGPVVADQIGGAVSSQLPGVVSDQIGAAVVTPVNDWLADNITQPTTPVVDASLSIPGAAADAAATGASIDAANYNIDRNTYDVGQLKEKFDVKRNYINPVYSTGFMKVNNTVDANSDFQYAAITVTDTLSDIYINGVTWYGTVQPYVYVQSDGTIVHPNLPSVSSITYVDYMKFTPADIGTLYVNRYHDDDRVNPYYPEVGYLTDSDVPYINQFFYGSVKNLESHGYLKTNGTMTYDSTLSYISERMACAEGEVFHYSGTYGSSAAACVYFDGDTVIGYESQVSLVQNETDFTVPSGATSLQFSSYHNPFTAYKKSSLFDSFLNINYIKNVLYGKKWFAFGDSFTCGDFTGYVDGQGRTGTSSDAYDPVRGMYKTWAWNIAERNNMNFTNKAQGGATTQYLTTGDLYQSVPADCDYVTFMLGLNDTSSSGSADSQDPTTWHGAWNVTLEWLRANRPHTKLGIIIPPSWLGNSWRIEIEAVAARHGVPVLNLYSDTKAPALLGTLDGSKLAKVGMNQAISQAVTANNVVTNTNEHPNIQCFEQMSDIIEVFMMGL